MPCLLFISQLKTKFFTNFLFLLSLSPRIDGIPNSVWWLGEPNFLCVGSINGSLTYNDRFSEISTQRYNKEGSHKKNHNRKYLVNCSLVVDIFFFHHIKQLASLKQ